MSETPDAEVERLAKWLYTFRDYPPWSTWEEASQYDKDPWRQAARDALAAARGTDATQ